MKAMTSCKLHRVVKFCAKLTAAVLLLTAVQVPLTKDVFAYDKTVTYQNFPSGVNDGEPIRGVDISSILSLEEAGVMFHDDAGNEADIFRVLYDHDVNYIRVRVWNEPNDGNGHSYGGGNNDVNAACEIGRRAAAYGMKLLVDIQYSDFWADPAKQTRPKYWASHDHDTLSGEIYKWTTWVLTAITEAGGDIGMVQVGNETNCFFCGEDDMYQICDLFASGDKAVRDFDRNILIAHHFANPSHADYYDWYAKVMNECNLDYDVFATSYYPYWQGTTENLTTVLKTIGDTYGKYVMVAETAYPYTSEDGDTFGNAVSAGADGADFRYAISVEGQAECLTDVFQAIANCGDKGLGVFYWEPAWLGVPDISWTEQKDKWTNHGSGWATDYAAEYDADATSAGGSSYDNQALFDFRGYPLDSLDVFTRIYPKNEKPVMETEPVTEPVTEPETEPETEATPSHREEITRWTADLDDDEELTVFDLALLKRAVLAPETLDEAQCAVCDLNDDSSVDVLDLLLLQHYLHGDRRGFPAGNQRRFVREW